MIRPFLGCALFVLAACSETENLSAPEASSVHSASSPHITGAVKISGDHLWDVDEAQSQLKFKAQASNEVITGYFSHFNVQVDLNPEAPEEGEIWAVVDITSLGMDNRDYKSMAESQSWFDSAHYPKAEFHSETITRYDADSYKADGVLTIKRQSVPVSTIFTLRAHDDQTVAEGFMQLDRLRLGVGVKHSGKAGSEALPDDVAPDVDPAVMVSYRLIAKRYPG